MPKEFVVIQNELHEAFTEITRLTPLITYHIRKHGVDKFELKYDARNYNFIAPEYFELFTAETNFEGCIKPEIIHPTTYYLSDIDKMGLVVCNKFCDATRIDLACQSSMHLNRFIVGSCAPSPEILCFGAGVLRPLFDQTPEKDMNKKKYWGRLDSLLMEPPAISYHPTFKNPHAGKYELEPWQSTNLMYGDTYGMLKQFLERRNNHNFLKYAVISLSAFKLENLENYYALPKQLIYSHFRPSRTLWSAPPESSDELIGRVEYLLEHTKIDKNPKRVFDFRPKNWLQKFKDLNRWKQIDGYDGWLQNPFLNSQ